jgi:hypothetical protein
MMTGGCARTICFQNREGKCVLQEEHKQALKVKADSSQKTNHNPLAVQEVYRSCEVPTAVERN